jgi:hypothetical protein
MDNCTILDLIRLYLYKILLLEEGAQILLMIAWMTIYRISVVK